MTLKGVGRKKSNAQVSGFCHRSFTVFLLVQGQQNDYFNYDLFKVDKMTYDFFKVSKMTTMFSDLFKVSKMTTMFSDLFKVRKMTNYYDLFKVSCA